MIVCENLVKIYKTREIEVVALQGLDLVVETGEMIAIIGNSGSGKSTLLNMLGGLDHPSAGGLTVFDNDLLKFTARQYVEYKRNIVGFVWQNNARNLIPYLPALDNVEMPMLFTGKRSRKRAEQLLDMVDLSHRRKSKLNQLSGGEQQRVAIALSLANSPKLLLADEPTGAVDSKTAEMIMDILRRINREMGVTIIIVTHDRQLSKQVDRVVAIRDGRTSSEFIRASAYSEAYRELDDLENEQVELAVVDRAGRVQIPREYLRDIGLEGQGRVLVSMNDGKIELQNQEQSFAKTPQDDLDS